MTLAELELADMDYAMYKVLADLGNPVGAYAESIQKESFSFSGGAVRDYWRMLIIVPGLPRMEVQFPAADLPCENCGVACPASQLSVGMCLQCWADFPVSVG